MGNSVFTVDVNLTGTEIQPDAYMISSTHPSILLFSYLGEIRQYGACLIG